MSELINAHIGRTSFRWQLLTTVSALALLGAVYGASEAMAADDGDHPTLWIELGGQLSRLADGQETFAATFPASPPRPSIFSPSQEFEKWPLNSIDEYGKVSFEPAASGWVFSASVRYGHSSGDKHVRQQTTPAPELHKLYYPSAQKFADTDTQSSEHHLIVDFQAGKDVGLGMFGGKGGSSVIGLGVRFAQFGSKSNIALKSNPDWHPHSYYLYGLKHTYVVGGTYHSNVAAMRAARSFHGIGPSLSWNASAPFMGNGQDSELTFDWGLNAAVLFGRQRAAVHYQTTGYYHNFKYYRSTPVHPTRRVDSHLSKTLPVRSRSVTVPNVGGFAGLSFRYADAKVSFGYRADFFFGAMDGGIDTAKKENVGFYGPFANVSVGIGG